VIHYDKSTGLPIFREVSFATHPNVTTSKNPRGKINMKMFQGDCGAPLLLVLNEKPQYAQGSYIANTRVIFQGICDYYDEQLGTTCYISPTELSDIKNWTAYVPKLSQPSTMVLTAVELEEKQEVFEATNPVHEQLEQIEIN
jgi:hypothetical protein